MKMNKDLKQTLQAIALVSLCSSYAAAETTLKDVKESSAQTADKVGQYSKEKFEATKAEMKKKMKEVDSEIESLKSKAKKLSSEQQAQLDSEIDNLKNKKALLEKDYDVFKSRSAQLWDTTKSRFEKLYQDIKSDIKATKEENSF